LFPSMREKSKKTMVRETSFRYRYSMTPVNYFHRPLQPSDLLLILLSCLPLPPRIEQLHLTRKKASLTLEPEIFSPASRGESPTPGRGTSCPKWTGDISIPQRGRS